LEDSDPEIKQAEAEVAKAAYDRKRKQNAEEAVTRVEERLRLDKMRLDREREKNPKKPEPKKGWFSRG